MTVIHTVECMQRTRNWYWFLISNPDVCKVCHGAGEMHSPGDWVPWGATSAQLPDNVDPCICVEAGHCPRCAHDLDREPRTWKEWLSSRLPPLVVSWLPQLGRTVIAHYGDNRILARDVVPLPLRCLHCGWSELKPTEGRPAEPECLCWEGSEGGYIWSL